MIDWDKVPGEVITVISDIHSNARALKAVSDTVKQKRTDQLVILGDIFTYGIDTRETADMVQKYIDDGAWLLMGNHDQIYLELISGNTKTLDKLRPDLKESITYNMDRLDEKQFISWHWQRQITHQKILFSHANPFGDLWGYINDIYDFQAAAKAVQHAGQIAGVFGHTHRDRYFSTKNPNLTSIEGLSDDVFVLNPGSVGQPRSTPRRATILRLSSHNDRLWAEIEPVDYDMQAHIDDLISSPLSEATKTILTSFFRE